MKYKIIISLTLFATGLIFVLISSMPLRINFEIPQLFEPTGIILLLSTFMYGVVTTNEVNTKNRNNKRLSSLLTPIYKFYFPTIFIITFIFNTALICFNIYPGEDISLFIVLELIFTIWIILAIPNSKLRIVYLDKNNIITTNYITKYIVPSNNIKSIERHFVVLYSISLKNNKDIQRIIFLPRQDGFPNIFTTPKSVQVLRTIIKQ
jgi:energy-converting hydrogenase Eha subunit C